MSKAQTDIRTTSYDAQSARPLGYQGTLDEVLAQIRAEPDTQHQGPRGRTELRMFLGVSPKGAADSNGPSVEMDDIQYGAPPAPPAPPSPHSLEHAMGRWPGNFKKPKRPSLTQDFIVRLAALTPSQVAAYVRARQDGDLSVNDALLYAEHYPYPAPRS